MFIAKAIKGSGCQFCLACSTASRPSLPEADLFLCCGCLWFGLNSYRLAAGGGSAFCSPRGARSASLWRFPAFLPWKQRGEASDHHARLERAGGVISVIITARITAPAEGTWSWVTARWVTSHGTQGRLSHRGHTNSQDRCVAFGTVKDLPFTFSDEGYLFCRESILFKIRWISTTPHGKHNLKFTEKTDLGRF